MSQCDRISLILIFSSHILMIFKILYSLSAALQGEVCIHCNLQTEKVKTKTQTQMYYYSRFDNDELGHTYLHLNISNNQFCVPISCSQVSSLRVSVAYRYRHRRYF